MTPFQYAKSKIAAGQFANMVISAGQFGTYWIEDENFSSLKGACFTSREAAEKARSKAIDKAMKIVMGCRS